MRYAGNDPEERKRLVESEQRFAKQIVQGMILANTFGIEEAYRIQNGKELEIDESDENV